MKAKDKCALCGKETDLTYEHIPPKGAFNDVPIKAVTLSEISKDFNRLPWDINGLTYISEQKGSGLYSLCKDCNNNTGSWYGNDYIDFVKKIDYVLNNYDLNEDKTIVIKNVYPLRIIKQIVSMFCSINNDVSNSLMDPLREFVLNKELMHLDLNKYKIHLYLTSNSYAKQVPYSALSITQNHKSFVIEMSELDTYPLIIMIYFNPIKEFDYAGFDITNFSDFRYDDKLTINIPGILKESNNIFPYDYRSKKEIIATWESNK